MLKPILLCCVWWLAGGALPGCAAAPGVMPTLSETVWSQLAAGQAQDLIVEFASLGDKPQALADLSTATVQVLKDFDALPMVLVRLRSAATLKTLLAHPAVVNVYQNQQENLLPAK